MRHFLLIYDHKTQSLRGVPQQFSEDEVDAATAAYEAAEAQYQSSEAIEIVLIGADSIEMIQRTHGHYFDGKDRLLKYLSPTGAQN